MTCSAIGDESMAPRIRTFRCQAPVARRRHRDDLHGAAQPRRVARAHAHDDADAVGPEQVVRALERAPVRRPRRAHDRDQRRARAHLEHARLGGGRTDDLDPLLGLVRVQAVAGLEQLVQRPGQRAVEQAGEAVGREAGALERDRLLVGQAYPHHLEHQRPLGHVQRSGGLGVRADGGGREHARARLEALPAQVRRQPRQARQVALDPPLRDEDAARPAAHAVHGAGRLERVERRAQRRAAHAEPGRQLALGAQALARPGCAGRDLGRKPVAQRRRRRAERREGGGQSGDGLGHAPAVRY